jgi:SAM-dependent methyltransferase
MPRFDTDRIRRYYDRQTAGFVALGQGGAEGAIHRAVWGPGTLTRAQAFHYVEERLVEAVSDLAASGASGILPHVLDLGCGVGGSLAYIAGRVPVRGTGVTLSPVQARIAAARIAAAGLADRIACVEADYTRLPPMAPVDLAFAIESFVHGPAPAAFFAECARVIRPGGRLVVCDDFRRIVSNPRAEPAIEQFRVGWHINTLLTREELAAHAAAAGFEHERSIDLTPWLELGRPRDRAIAAFVAAFGWLPLERTPIAHLVGGAALQTCLRRGWVGYELAIFRLN